MTENAGATFKGAVFGFVVGALVVGIVAPFAPSALVAAAGSCVSVLLAAAWLWAMEASGS